jgi:hypothetical protein
MYPPSTSLAPSRAASRMMSSVSVQSVPGNPYLYTEPAARIGQRPAFASTFSN